MYDEDDCEKETFFICEQKLIEKARFKRNSNNSMDKKFLKKAYDKANSSVQVVEQEAEQITMEEIAEVEDRQRILNNWIGNQNTSCAQKF